MIDVMRDASNYFLAFFSCLPYPIQFLVYLAAGLFVISAIVNIVFR